LKVVGFEKGGNANVVDGCLGKEMKKSEMKRKGPSSPLPFPPVSRGRWIRAGEKKRQCKYVWYLG
jgi:hypothetical protein